jgi:hypothetical protein
VSDGLGEGTSPTPAVVFEVRADCFGRRREQRRQFVIR